MRGAARGLTDERGLLGNGTGATFFGDLGAGTGRFGDGDSDELDDPFLKIPLKTSENFPLCNPER